LRRKLPLARIMVGCWVEDAVAAAQFQETAKADFVAPSLREATRICVALARVTPDATADVAAEKLFAKAR
jgi:hypothetical protein